jgi:hypothetical protein
MMNRAEAKKLVGIAVAFFPAMQDKDMGPTVIGWEAMLKDVPYKLAEMALKKVLSTAKFFPTIAEIREAVAEITNPQMPSWTEAWGEVVQAVRQYGYMREKEALESLSPAAAKVVRWFGWQEICRSEEPDVIRGQFRMAYEAQAKREREMAVLPTEIRELIGGTAKALPKPN